MYATVPEEGVPFEAVLQHLDELRAKEEPKWSKGYVSGAVYLGEKEFSEFLNKVYILYSSTNALHPDIWPSLRKFESEVVSMAVRLLNGGKDACGLMTSGGTESLVMACKTCVCVVAFVDWLTSRLSGIATGARASRAFGTRRLWRPSRRMRPLTRPAPTWA